MGLWKTVPRVIARISDGLSVSPGLKLTGTAIKTNTEVIEMDEKRLREMVKSWSPKHLHKEIDEMSYGKLRRGTVKLLGALALPEAGEALNKSIRRKH